MLTAQSQCRHFLLSQFWGMLLTFRVKARMRLAPGQNPMCDLPGCTIGSYRGIAWQASWDNAPSPRSIPEGVAVRTGTLICSPAFLAQAPPTGLLLRGPWLSPFSAVSTEASLWGLVRGKGIDQDTIFRSQFFHSSFSTSPYPRFLGSQNGRNFLFCASQETISSTCPACHLTGPCPLPFHGGAWHSEEPALLAFLASCLSQ